ncbi:MAG: zinc ribbon domain-containing protein [Chloroflexi bacterium]|nr:zinc ribbon domain-containing protein [Chloroflexota bacterium]
MVTLVIFLMAAAALAALAYPLLRQQAALLEEAPDEEREALQSRRDVTYSAIKELEFDYQVGSLSPAEYQALDEKYKDKAVTVLKDIDRLGQLDRRGRAAPPPEDDIERQVRRLRSSGAAARQGAGPGRAPRPNRGDAVEREVRALRQGKPSAAGFCPQCGQAQRPGDKFCARCGTSLTRGEPKG